MFRDVLSGAEEMVAAEFIADGQSTHPLPPLGLYVTLYKAFLSVSQAWCVYSAMGAYPWHWLLEPHWRFRAARLIGASRGNSEGQTHCTGYALYPATAAQPRLQVGTQFMFFGLACFFWTNWRTPCRDSADLAPLLTPEISQATAALKFHIYRLSWQERKKNWAFIQVLTEVHSDRS